MFSSVDSDVELDMNLVPASQTRHGPDAVVSDSALPTVPSLRVAMQSANRPPPAETDIPFAAKASASAPSRSR